MEDVLLTYKEMDWRKELKENVIDANELADMGYIRPDEAEALNKVIDKYPMSIPRYYLGLIDKKDDSDPIYKMCIASLAEAGAGGSFDTSGEGTNTVMNGIQHKYDNTVLLLSTNICAMYCRHCFRKRLVGQSEEEILSFTERAVSYIASRKEVDNVLITGGDALMNSNRVIKRYLEALCDIPHVKYIRFGSRLPVVFPQRIYGDKELLELFETYGKQKTIYVVTQFNHPRELTKEAIRATDSLRQAGVPILNQTVLLKGVNADANTLTSLFNNLTANGISPYYLFQCRPVKGVKNLFSVPLLQAVDIVDETRARLSGVAKRFRFSMSHLRGKIEIIGKTSTNALIMKQHQAKENDNLNELFKVTVSPSDTWLDDDFIYESV